MRSVSVRPLAFASLSLVVTALACSSSVPAESGPDVEVAGDLHTLQRAAPLDASVPDVCDQTKCPAHTFCTDCTGSGHETCQPLRACRPGQHCSLPGDCGPGPGGAPMTCSGCYAVPGTNGTGVCVPVSSGGAGSTCDQFNGSTYCAPGTTCVPHSTGACGTCTANGQPEAGGGTSGGSDPPPDTQICQILCGGLYPNDPVKKAACFAACIEFNTSDQDLCLWLDRFCQGITEASGDDSPASINCWNAWLKLGCEYYAEPVAAAP